MALLDLQALELSAEMKGCGGHGCDDDCRDGSFLSLLLCG
ncbi:MAG TPA: SapB/AmfS family lanthipeptide [Pseudonocardiaceae bacterium]|nr:SapB/AmfS family lanthipeptide [Pseudonocardiaceae bacterium]